MVFPSPSLTNSSHPQTKSIHVADQGLDAIRHANIFPALIAVLSSPTVGDEVLQKAMLAVCNCTAPMHKTVLHPSTGQPVKVPIDSIPRSENEDYGKWRVKGK
jgi:hypothetical protein